MTTITVSDDSGQLTVSMDGQETPVESAEQACQMIEQAFGQSDQDDAMASAQKGYGSKPRMMGVGDVFPSGV